MFVDIKDFLRFLCRFSLWRFSRICFHIVFIVCINKKTEAFSYNLRPVYSMFKLIDIRLVTNLTSHDLLFEQIADRSVKTIKHFPNRISIVAQ